MKRSNDGFTLIELVLVILVLAIVSTGVTKFITFGVNIYQDTAGRDKQISDSRFVIERITREIRNALPNSVRVIDNKNDEIDGNDGKCVEFIPILASSSYVEIPVLPSSPSNEVEVVVSKERFDLQPLKMVVYPLSENDVYVNGNSTTGKVFTIETYNISGYNNPNDYVTPLTVILDNSVTFDEHSPTQRYFIIGGSVAYCQGSDQTIKRYQGHVLTTVQSFPPIGTGVLMAEHQTNERPFSLLKETLQRNAIVQMDFTFAYADENLRLINEVHIANVP